MHFDTKEQLTNYMTLGSVHLNRKDYYFFSNLQNNIKQNHQITSNQDKLFNKLLQKYSRQLQKLGYNFKELQDIKWKTEIVESLPEFTNARIYVEHDTIKIKSPFSNKFLKAFRSLDFNPFTWNKPLKLYEAKFSLYAFKMALEQVKNHYTDIILCERLTNLLNTLNEYNDLIWNPTYVRINGIYYVVAANQHVMDSLNNLEFNDDPETLYTLYKKGINVSKNILDTEEKDFAVSRYVNISSTNLSDLVKYLTLLNITIVQIGRELNYNRDLSKKVRSILQEANINVVVDTFDLYNHKDAEVYIQYQRGDYTYQDSHITKVIQILNNNTINVK
jgi:hypothetical protein